MGNINSLAAGLLVIASTALPANGPALGAQPDFIGKVIVEWLDGESDRDMVLLEDFGFRDSSGKLWLAPKGTKVDGASIPRLFWTLVGSPYTGRYRRASIVHDYYCQTRAEPWEAVHRMFYDASIAAGESSSRALTMYAAILAKGPRWQALVIKGMIGGDSNVIMDVAPAVSDAEALSIVDQAVANTTDPDEVERRVLLLTRKN